MKMLTAICMLVLSLSGFASTETRNFFFDGTQDSVQMSLNAEETHTEYRYETRQTICYRQDVYYQTVCSQGPNGQRICQTIPHYRTVSYPCMQTIQIPYEVKDFDVQAQVSLNVVNASSLPAGENFKVTLDEDRLSLSASGSKKFFILLKKQQVNTSIRGSMKFIEAAYSAELVEAGAVVKALSMTNIGLKDTVLSFKMGPVEARELIGFKLTVKKSPILGSDTVLFDRELAASEIQLSAQGNASAADINIEKLGVELSSGRYNLTASAFYKHTGTLLNSGDFPATEVSRTLIYKIR